MSARPPTPGGCRLLHEANLDAWSPAQAAARNALLGRHVAWRDPDDGGSWNFEWMDEAFRLEAGVDVALRLGNDRFVLTFEQIDSLMPFPGVIAFASLPQVTKRALLATAFRGPVQALERTTGRPVLIDAVCDADRHRAAHRSLGFRTGRAGGARSSRGRLEAVSDDGLAALATLCRRWARTRGELAAAGWPVNLRLLVGATRLPASDLRRIEPGDLLLVAHRPGLQADANAIRVGVFAGSSPCSKWIGELEQSHMVLQHNGPHAQVSVAEHAAAGADAGEGSIEGLEVSLEFWLGELRVSVEELASFQVGRLVPLGQPVDGAVVHLVVAGQRVGQGRLVVIGEQVGVQVTRLGAHAA